MNKTMALFVHDISKFHSSIELNFEILPIVFVQNVTTNLALPFAFIIPEISIIKWMS